MSPDSQTTSLATSPKVSGYLVRGPWSVVRGPWSRSVRRWWPLALFSVLWLDLIRQLSYGWSSYEQYTYGWFVPFLALGLLWKRAADPPKPQPMTPPTWMLCLVATVMFVLLPVRVIHEINQDWPLFTWPLTAGVVALSLYAVFLLGGWPWVRHFAFPVCFILVAATWPFRVENGLIQSLTHAVTTLTVTVLGWVDILASQHGNVIEISTGVVGIDEACSGIRSFQSMIMGALFLGELYRLRWPHRLALIGSGVVVAFCLNVVRTLILTWRASEAGIDLVAKWHDPAGISIFLASFACLWLIAWRLRKSEHESRELIVHSRRAHVQSPKSNVQSQGAAGQSPVVRGLWSGGPWSAGPWVPKSLSPLVHFLSSPCLFLTAVGCWTLCILALNELWYRAHDVKAAGVYHWSVNMPESLPTFAKIDLAQTITRKLGYDVGAAAKWREPDGSDWSLFFFKWNTGSAQSLMLARLHRPDICLPASGSRQLTPSQRVWIEAGPLRLPFLMSVYEVAGARAYVFFCRWEEGTETQLGLWASPQTDRIRSVLVGRRHLAQQTLEIVVSGCENFQAAEQQVRQHLPELVRLEPAEPSRRTRG